MAPSFLFLLRGAMAPLSLLLLSLSSADAYTLHVTGESTRLVLDASGGGCGREAQLVRHGLVDPLQLCLRVHNAGRLTGRLTGRHAGRRRTPTARRLVMLRFRFMLRVRINKTCRQRAAKNACEAGWRLERGEADGSAARNDNVVS